MTAGDVGVYVYAFTGGYVMNASGTAQQKIQLQKTGTPPVVMPITTGLPPHGAPGPLPDPILVTMTIGSAPFIDSEGVTHAPGTWAYFVTAGTEYPVGGIYNTWLVYTYTGIKLTSQVVTKQVFA